MVALYSENIFDAYRTKSRNALLILIAVKITNVIYQYVKYKTVYSIVGNGAFPDYVKSSYF